ncbi:prolactin-releasing peptide [Osmerus eperlanus]|uniref:prolactin-releasing peptide n=1 Tax=Osmerus eperlanus TaxID=29151 RepID=UPI002E13CDDC
MRVCAVLCALVLLTRTLAKTQAGYPDRSMEIRNPDIIASWYTGRGIRPVGRFGRRETERNRGLAVPTHRVCAPATRSDDWIRD